MVWIAVSMELFYWWNPRKELIVGDTLYLNLSNTNQCLIALHTFSLISIAYLSIILSIPIFLSSFLNIQNSSHCVVAIEKHTQWTVKQKQTQFWMFVIVAKHSLRFCVWQVCYLFLTSTCTEEGKEIDNFITISYNHIRTIHKRKHVATNITRNLGIT